MENVQFRGAFMRSFQSPPRGETTPFVRSYWTADFGEPANEKMGWSDPGECGVTEADLIGEIGACTVSFKPHDPELAKMYSLEFEAFEITNFELHSVKRGEATVKEIRFIIRSNNRGDAALLEQWRHDMLEKPSMMTFSYVKQEKLDLGESPDKPNGSGKKAGKDKDLEIFGPDEGPCISCNVRTPFEDTERTTHANGLPCKRASASTLASAREAAGGTHAKRGRKTVGGEVQ